MIVCSWKSRPRKEALEEIPTTLKGWYHALQPQTSPFPLHFVVFQICPPKPSLRLLSVLPSLKEDSELARAALKSDQLETTQTEICIYYFDSLFDGERIVVNAIGVDIGTKNVVVALRSNKKTIFLREINGYYVFPRPTKFVENMLDDPSKVRSDGTKRAAKWIKLDNRDGLYVLGRDAEEFAYAHNDTLLRPMAEGGVAPDEDAMTILASIVQGLLAMAEHEVGQFQDEVKLCYCVTAPALNRQSNVEYHKQVIDLIITNYKTAAKIGSETIRESHAIVLKESTDGTGIGISWGAGTVTVSYVLWGTEIYSFSWVGAGDWIDLQVACRHGYDPESPRKRSPETPTTVCRAKEQIDLLKDYTTRLELDIVLHYRILIQNVIRGIVQGFIDNESRARIDKPIDVYMAGGTSSPNGFEELVSQLFAEQQPPFSINKIVRCKDPLFAVALGCLQAAEMQ